MFKRDQHAKVAQCLLAALVLIFSLLIYWPDFINQRIIAPYRHLFYAVASVSEQAQESISNKKQRLHTMDELITMNEQLQLENIRLRVQTQDFDFLLKENAALKGMKADIDPRYRDDSLAIVLHALSDRNQQLLIINQGSDDGVDEGQAIINGKGVIGQVMSVDTHHAVVLSITDRRSYIPIEITPSGHRAIARGYGDTHTLEVLNILEQKDLHIGDEVVASGVGGVFPRGYPIGQIERIEDDGHTDYLTVTISTYANLHDHYVVLVGSDHG